MPAPLRSPTKRRPGAARRTLGAGPPRQAPAQRCLASLRALDVSGIDLYQLHAIDPRVPFETSVRELAALQQAGLIRRIGLSNVTVLHIKAAQKIAEVASVQVSLSVFDDENLRNGVVEYCRDQGIQLSAYRPLGGSRIKARSSEFELSERDRAQLE